MARSNNFRKLLSDVGLAKLLRVKTAEGTRRDTQELSFHSLRHTATSMLKAAGVSDCHCRRHHRP
jgi:integrase